MEALKGNQYSVFHGSTLVNADFGFRLKPTRRRTRPGDKQANVKPSEREGT
jgi:hypothetical protein